MTQIYSSSSSNTEEIAYRFPLPADAAVCAFTAVLGGRTIRGIVKEKMEAKEAYEAAVAQGKKAALLEEQRAEGVHGVLLPHCLWLTQLQYSRSCSATLSLAVRSK